MKVLFVIAGTAIIFFLSWILLKVTDWNVDSIFKIIKIDLILSFSLTAIVWCFKIVLTHQIFELDYITEMLIITCFFMLMNVFYWLAYYKWKKFHKSVSIDLEMGGIFSRQMLLYVIDIIAPPVWSLYCAWYLISTYYIK